MCSWCYLEWETAGTTQYLVVFEALVDEEEEVGNTHRRPSHRDEVEPMELEEEVVVLEGQERERLVV